MVEKNNKKANNSIKIVDSVPYEELGKHIANSSCVVVPSIAEGFGYNAVEASTLGVPVLVSDAGSLPEVISGKHLLFKNKNIDDLTEKVVKINRDEYEETKQKKFLWQQTINEYLNTYKILIGIKKGF